MALCMAASRFKDKDKRKGLDILAKRCLRSQTCEQPYNLTVALAVADELIWMN